MSGIRRLMVPMKKELPRLKKPRSSLSNVTLNGRTSNTASCTYCLRSALQPIVQAVRGFKVKVTRRSGMQSLRDNYVLRQKEHELWQWLQQRQAPPLPRLLAVPQDDPVFATTRRCLDTSRPLEERVWALGDTLKRDTLHWPCGCLWVRLQYDGRTLIGTLQLYDVQ